MAYMEIEDIDRIRQLGAILHRRLIAASVEAELRVVGYPGGKETRKVYFFEPGADQAMWYSSWKSSEGRAIHLFGLGTYKGTDALMIDVQFNYRIKEFSRTQGAAFLIDPMTDEVLLAHRGHVTIGQRVKKEILFESMATDVVEVATTKGNKEFLLIAPLESHTLAEDIGEFARGLREKLRGLDESDSLADKEVKSSDTETDDAFDDVEVEDDDAVPETGGGFDGLRMYFKEFSGKRASFKPKRVYPESYHGKVVDALHDLLAGSGQILKSRAIDLVQDKADVAFVFEIKTDSNSTSIYGAIGQLSIHASCVHTYLGKRTVKVMVVPTLPQRWLTALIETELDVRVITYTLNQRGKVAFDGLELLE